MVSRATSITARGATVRMSSARKTGGFSLIETLVVLAIIGVLVGILVPAIMKVRVSAVRLQCENNLRQSGLAMQGYVSANGGFPPSVAYSMGWDKGSPTGTI